MTELEALQQAIDNAGSQTALAEKIGVKQQTVSHWVRKFKKASPVYALKIEKATGVPRHELAPDMYPEEHAA